MSLKWYAIFAGAAGEAASVEVAAEGDLLARFDMAVLLGRIGRQSIRAMWIIDQANDEVLRVHGPLPRSIAERHHGTMSKRPLAPSLTLAQLPPRDRR